MDDLISRQAVKEWLAKWEGYIDADIIARMQYRIIDIPSAQPVDKDTNVPCTDTISRKAAIDAVSRGCQEFRGIFAECEKNLNELPSAQPDVDLFPDLSEEYRQGYRDGLRDKPEPYAERRTDG